MDDSKNIELGEIFDEDVLTTTQPDCWVYMMKMLGEAIHADVTLKAAGGEVVKAHCSVLTLFSPVFNTMFTCGMQEHHTGVVELMDIDIEVLKLFLVVLYSGAKCEMLLNNNVVDKHLKELIKVCHKYEVTHVFATLSSLVKRSLTVENCCDYLVCATKFCPDDECTSYISTYITKKFHLVIETIGFMCLAYTHPALAVQLVRLEKKENVNAKLCRLGTFLK